MKNTISSLAARLVEALPGEFKKAGDSVKSTAEKVIHDALVKMELVTREEFDAQVKAVEKTQEKLALLTQQVAELEKKKTDH